MIIDNYTENNYTRTEPAPYEQSIQASRPNLSPSQYERIHQQFIIWENIEKHAAANEMVEIIRDGLELFSYYEEIDSSDKRGFSIGSYFKKYCLLALGEKGIAEIVDLAKQFDPIAIYLCRLHGTIVAPETLPISQLEDSTLSSQSENEAVKEIRSLFFARNYSGLIQKMDSDFIENNFSCREDEAFQLRILAKVFANDIEGAIEDCQELGYAQRIIQSSVLQAIAGNFDEAAMHLRNFYLDIDSTATSDSEESSGKFRFTEEHFMALLLEQIILNQKFQKPL